MSAPAGVAGCGARCRAMSIVLAALAGAVFGAGLLLGGMTDPGRVVAFLDVGSGWDPALGFVMGGAVAVYAVVFRLVRRWRRDPWFDVAFHLPTRHDVDLPLVAGAAIFGAGWGLAGMCPGPGLVAAAGGNPGGLAFVAAMIVGMLAQRGAMRR